MNSCLDPYDCDGRKIAVGDDVLYVKVTDQILRDLPEEDQTAIKAQEGKILKVMALDGTTGRAEIEFEYEREDSEVTFHTIWVDPNCLKKIADVT